MFSSGGVTSCWEHSVALASEMQRAQVALDVVSYTALVTAGPAMGSTCMVGLLAQMTAKQLQPQTLTFNAALHACQSSLSWAAAVQIFLGSRGSRVRMDAVSCVALLDSLAWSGSFGRLQELLPAIQRENLRLRGRK